MVFDTLVQVLGAEIICIVLHSLVPERLFYTVP